jgi:PAS domain S-box-containing protein
MPIMAKSRNDPLVWRTNLDDLPEPFVAVDEDGAIVEFNSAAERLFGHSRAEVVRRGSSLLLAERDREAHATGIADLLSAGERPALGAQASSAVVRRDGSETAAELIVTHVGDSPPLTGIVVRAPSAAPDADERLWSQAELLKAAAESAELGTWYWDTADGVLVWSPKMYAIHGVTEEGFTLTPESALACVARLDLPRVAAASSQLVQSGHMPRTEYRVVRPDGVVRWVVSTARRVTSPHRATARYVGAARDTTDAHFAEDELHAIHDVSWALTAWDTFDDPLNELLARIGNAFGWVAGALWTPAETEARLRCRAFWSAPDAKAAAFEAATRKLSVPRGAESLAGRAFSTGGPAGTSGAGGDFAFGRRPAAEEAGLRGGVAFPIGEGTAILGSLEFYGREIRAPSERMFRTLTVLSQGIGRFLSRRTSALNPSPLSPREGEVLQLAARGLSTPEIALELVISQSTVKTHFEKLYYRLGVRDRAAAVAEGFRRGLID